MLLSSLTFFILVHFLRGHSLDVRSDLSLNSTPLQTDPMSIPDDHLEKRTAD